MKSMHVYETGHMRLKASSNFDVECSQYCCNVEILPSTANDNHTITILLVDIYYY